MRFRVSLSREGLISQNVYAARWIVPRLRVTARVLETFSSRFRCWLHRARASVGVPGPRQTIRSLGRRHGGSGWLPRSSGALVSTSRALCSSSGAAPAVHAWCFATGLGGSGVSAGLRYWPPCRRGWRLEGRGTERNARPLRLFWRGAAVKCMRRRDDSGRCFVPAGGGER